MIAALVTPAVLLVSQVSAAPRTTVTYRDLPAAVVSVHLLEWRDGHAPVELRSNSDMASEAGVARVDCVVGTVVIVSLAGANGMYLLDGPFDCPATASERRADPIWRRTLRVRSPPDLHAGGDLIWVPANREAPAAWPRCAWIGAIAECWGSAVDAPGVFVFTEADRVWWTLLAPPAPVGDFQPSRWARLILEGDVGEHAPMAATIAHPRTSAERRASLRLETALVPGAHAIPIGATAVWVYGEQVPEAAWIQITAPGAGPAYFALEEVAHAPASLPLWVALEAARQLDGVARGSSGGVAAGAVVTLFRSIDPPPARGAADKPPRRVFVGETIADAAGEFHFDGLGDADYEVVAWQPQLGRGIVAVARGDTSVAVRLDSSGQVRGRVLAAGQPLAGVDVVSLPDPGAFARAADLTDVKGGDARTGGDGRFAVSLAPGGGGEVRVGGGSYPIRRFPLPRAPVPVVDLGDIDLGAPIVVTVVLDRDPGCDVRATGPIGRTGLQLIAGTRAGPGLFTIAFPEEGMWEVHLVCGRDEHALAPSVVSIAQASSGREVRLMVR